VRTEGTVYWSLGELTKWDPKIEWNLLEENGTRSVEQTGVHQGASNHSFDTEFLLTDGRVILLAMNAGTGSAAPYTITDADPLFTHTMVPANTLHYFSCEGISARDKSDLFLGSWVKTLTLSAAKGDYVKCKLSANALEYDGTQVAPTVIAPTVEPYRFGMGALSIAAVNYDSVVHSFELSIENDIERGPAFDEGDGDYHTMGSRRTKCTLVLDVPNNDAVLLALVTAATETAVILTLTRGANDIVEITLPTTKVVKFPKTWEKSIRVALEFQSYGEAWDIEIQDLIDNYSTSS